MTINLVKILCCNKIIINSKKTYKYSNFTDNHCFSIKNKSNKLKMIDNQQKRLLILTIRKMILTQ
jgi:ribosomal protein L13